MKTTKTAAEINSIMHELAEYSAMQDELNTQIESLKDEIKLYMQETGQDELIADNGSKATFRDVISNRFASTEFKKVHADLYAAYLKKTTCRRFTFNR